MNLTRPRVLVVANNPSLCFTLEEMLRHYDYDVTATTDSATAQALIAQHLFESVLFADEASEAAAETICAPLKERACG